MKICLIRQPAGLGDILFCQKIAKRIIEKYNLDIIWPVIPQFEWISQYLSSDRITFVSTESDFTHKELYNSQCNIIVDRPDVMYIPLQHADQHNLHSSVMDSKYKFVSLSYENWADFILFNRNEKTESKLFYDILNLTLDEKYVVVNKNYGSPPTSLVCPHLNIETNIKIVNLEFIDDITLLDWCMVLENAYQIHTVETSLNFVIEKLPRCTGLNMYSKWTPPNYNHVRHLFRSDWIYHY